MQDSPYCVENSNSKPDFKCIIPNYACKGYSNSNKRDKHVLEVK